MLHKLKATYNAILEENVVEITQLSSGKVAKVDAFILLELLEHNDRNTHSKHCHKCNMKITYDPTNFHLYSYPQVINTYLTKGDDYDLKQYILNKFKDIKRASAISSINEILIGASEKTNTPISPMTLERAILDLSLEKYLSSLTGNDLLFLYNKRIIMDAQTSREELLWEM